MLRKKELYDCFRSGRKTIGEHEPLAALTFGADDSDYVADWSEALFTVPYEWLRKHMEKATDKKWTLKRLKKWLCEEYTSDDSSEIFDSAVLERQLVTMNIN